MDKREVALAILPGILATMGPTTIGLTAQAWEGSPVNIYKPEIAIQLAYKYAEAFLKFDSQEGQE